MKKPLQILQFIIIIIFIYLIFTNKYIVKSSVLLSFNIWLNNIMPSLFIMFIITDIINYTNILSIITKPFNKLFNKIFNISNYSLDILLTSIISGTPASTHLLLEMLNNNKIDSNDANKMISYTYFSNPLFLYNILSISFNKHTTIKIILISYISNILVGIILRNKYKNNINNKIEEKVKLNFFKILSTSIKNSINTMIMILGTITFYMIISNIIINTFNFNNTSIVFIKGVFEITQGLNSLNIINNNYTKEVLALIIISFSGLSIHSQIKSILDNSKILYINYLKGRILQISIIIIIEMLKMLLLLNYRFQHIII